MLTTQTAIKLLKEHAPNKSVYSKVLKHSQTVQKAALQIFDKIKQGDRNFIKIACLLHDIGRLYYPPGSKDSIQHGVKGGEILRQLGYERFARVCERHIGVGISLIDIEQQKLPLPCRDFMPETVEEKIICYADNLIFGTRKGKVEEVVERYNKELGKEYGQRFRKLHSDIMFLVEDRKRQVAEWKKEEEKHKKKSNKKP